MFHLLFFLIFIHLLPNSQSFPVNSTVGIAACAITFDCGNGLAFSYPFWRINSGSQYCGYPSLGITCGKNSKPILHLLAHDNYVDAIDHELKTVTLIDTNVIDQDCPRVHQNVTLDAFHNLEYSSKDEKLRFFFNCSTSSSSHSLNDSQSISCLNHGSNRSFVFLDGEAIPEFDWFAKCEDNVLAPVMGAENVYDPRNLSKAFPGVLQKGFRLSWKQSPRCGSCEESKGYCGYRNSTGEWEFACFCDDGIHEKSCNDEEEASRVNQGQSKGSKYTMADILESGWPIYC